MVIVKTQDEISQLEAYVYNESQENLYAHHDLMLPNFSLRLEWLDFPFASSSATSSTSPKNEFGNHIAVGTMNPEIEIWSLDVLEGMYPDNRYGPGQARRIHDTCPCTPWHVQEEKLKHRVHKDKIKNPPSSWAGVTTVRLGRLNHEHPNCVWAQSRFCVETYGIHMVSTLVPP